MTHYILIDKIAVPEPDLHKWAVWVGTADRRVAETQIGGIWVSTVFIGLDHSFGDGPPLLFETMAFRGGSGQECERYSSWQEAEAGHAKMVDAIRAEIKCHRSQVRAFCEKLPMKPRFSIRLPRSKPKSGKSIC